MSQADEVVRVVELIIVFLGPCSEFVGRSRVLHYSFIAFFCKSLGYVTAMLSSVLNFHVAFGAYGRAEEESGTDT